MSIEIVMMYQRRGAANQANVPNNDGHEPAQLGAHGQDGPNPAQPQNQDGLEMLAEILRQNQIANQTALQAIAANLEARQESRPREDASQGEAGVWWRTVVQNYPAVLSGTWGQFKSHFNEQFFPECIKDQLAGQFVELKQGALTVAQYGAKFRELSRFAPGYAATEADRVRKFVSGLRPSIKASIVNLGTGRVIEGQLLVNSISVHVLFDSGSTLSFISPDFVRELGLSPVPLLHPLRVVTPIGDVVVTDRICKGCIIKIGDRELLGELVLLKMNDFKVILGMDWLASYHASVDCFHKVVVFRIPGEEEFMFEGVKRPGKIKIIAALRAQKMLSRGCEGFLAYVKKEDDGVGLSAADISVVSEFLDVFPEDLTELPPHREIDFTIDLEPGTLPISKAPYRMAPAELKELKE
ncbi:uncharacterized protein LOC143888354 [Tasmannia lanceolata]|uniref:uncharacterized protein LOC143888354 n=1 Tax=Tasmannia lanceolata TaxID=3420 RepID=UPI00406351AC